MQGWILIFVTSFMIALSGALMPGPLLTVTIADASKKGFRVGPLIVLGHGILELALVFLILAGLGPWIRRPEIAGIFGIAGGVVLWWFGFTMIRDSQRVRPSAEYQKTNDSHSGKPVLIGILVSLANPYWSLWWATIGMGYLAAAWKYGPAGVLVFFSGHILADLLWYSTISFAVSRGRSWISTPFYQRMILLCGLFLMVFGIWFLHFGWRSFRHL